MRNKDALPALATSLLVLSSSFDSGDGWLRTNYYAGLLRRRVVNFETVKEEISRLPHDDSRHDKEIAKHASGILILVLNVHTHAQEINSFSAEQCQNLYQSLTRVRTELPLIVDYFSKSDRIIKRAKVQNSLTGHVSSLIKSNSLTSMIEALVANVCDRHSAILDQSVHQCEEPLPTQ